MADLDIEDDLRALFDHAPPASDASAFAARVDRGLDRMMWLRLAVVGTLGLVGVLIAWLMLGQQAGQVLNSLGDVTTAARQGRISDDAGGWAAAILLLALGLLLVRPVFSEG